MAVNSVFSGARYAAPPRFQGKFTFGSPLPPALTLDRLQEDITTLTRDGRDDDYGSCDTASRKGRLVVWTYTGSKLERRIQALLGNLRLAVGKDYTYREDSGLGTVPPDGRPIPGIVERHLERLLTAEPVSNDPPLKHAA